MIGFKNKLFAFYVGRNNTLSGEPLGFWFAWRPRRVERQTPWGLARFPKIAYDVGVSVGVGVDGLWVNAL